MRWNYAKNSARITARVPYPRNYYKEIKSPDLTLSLEEFIELARKKSHSSWPRRNWTTSWEIKNLPKKKWNYFHLGWKNDTSWLKLLLWRTTETDMCFFRSLNFKSLMVQFYRQMFHQEDAVNIFPSNFFFRKIVRGKLISFFMQFSAVFI